MLEGYQTQLSLAGGIDYSWNVLPSFEELEVRGHFVGSVVGRCRLTGSNPCRKRLWFQRLKLEYEEPLLNFPFNFNLRRYTMDITEGGEDFTSGDLLAANIGFDKKVRSCSGVGSHGGQGGSLVPPHTR